MPPELKTFIEQLLNGITVGSLYALIASGVHHGVWGIVDGQFCPWRYLHGGSLCWVYSPWLDLR